MRRRDFLKAVSTSSIATLLSTSTVAGKQGRSERIYAYAKATYNTGFACMEVKNEGGKVRAPGELITMQELPFAKGETVIWQCIKCKAWSPVLQEECTSHIAGKGRHCTCMWFIPSVLTTVGNASLDLDRWAVIHHAILQQQAKLTSDQYTFYADWMHKYGKE